MMFKKWDDEFATGVMVDGHGILANVQGRPRFPIKLEECEAGMGDLLEKYISLRESGYWWRRWLHQYAHIEAQTMRDKLNEMATVRWMR